jgi:hypothetical protein
MKKLILTLFLLLNISLIIKAQDSANTDSSNMEIFLIDSYVQPEPPNNFILSFYTSSVCMSNVIIDERYDIVVSNFLSESHSIKIDLAEMNILNKEVKFVIVTIDSLGRKQISETFEFALPFEPIIKEGSSLFTLCLFAGIVFGLPAPGYARIDGRDYFSLTKEIPILSFRSSGKNYPAGYISLEYTYIFNAVYRKFLRIGYKRIFEIPVFEYISPGLTAYSNFSSQNGIAPEISLGLFSIYNTFTFYTRYRYNIKPSDSNSNFHEINLGLYTRFFSLYL